MGSMSPPSASVAASRTMRANRSRDTKRGVALRRILHLHGLRYRVDAPLPMNRRRRSDVMFSRARIAVFSDGCLWHGYLDHATLPISIRVFWAEKIAIDRQRFADTNRLLSDAGWLVLRFWEHEPPEGAADRAEQEG